MKTEKQNNAKGNCCRLSLGHISSHISIYDIDNVDNIVDKIKRCHPEHQAWAIKPHVVLALHLGWLSSLSFDGPPVQVDLESSFPCLHFLLMSLECPLATMVVELDVIEDFFDGVNLVYLLTRPFVTTG